MRDHEYDKLIRQISFDPQGGFKEQCIELGSALTQLVRDEGIDIVHVTSPVTPDTIFPTSSQLPIISTMYDLIPIVLKYNPGFYSDEAYAYYLLKLSLMRRYSRRVVAISNNTKKDLMRLLEMPSERINVVHPTWEEWAHAPSEREAEKVRRKLGIDKDYLLYVGGWDHRKNIESLIIAYGRLPENLRKEHSLVIDAEFGSSAKAHFDELIHSTAGEVVVAGYVPEDYLGPLYKGAEMLVIPSFYEGFSYPALEGMYFGLAIAASNASSLPEVAGDAAIYFDPNKPDEMSDALRRVLESKKLRDELVEAGRHRLKSFEPTQAAQSLIGCYREVIRESSRQSGRIARIAFVSPIPPAKSGVARYASDLLPHLGKYFDIDIYSDTKLGDGQDSYRLEDYVACRESYDLTFYQMGNSQAHDGIYTLVVNFPGITVLHDNNLHSFIYHRALVWRNEPHKYEMELAAQYGADGLRLARTLVNAGLSPETAQMNPLYFTTAMSSDILVITSDRVPPEFKSLWNTPVRSVPLGVRISVLQEDEVKRIRREYDIPDDAFVVLTAGFIERHGLIERRISLCLQVFKRLVLQNANCRYIVAGLTEDARRDLQELVSGLGLEKEVRLLEDSAERTFDNMNQLSDVRLELRHPCFAFASGSILSSLACGKPVIASENSATETLPTSCVWKVKPEEPYEAELLYRFLDRLRNDHELRLEMGRKALEYCAQRTWPRIAQRIHDVVLNSTSL